MLFDSFRNILGFSSSWGFCPQIDFLAWIGQSWAWVQANEQNILPVLASEGPALERLFSMNFNTWPENSPSLHHVQILRQLKHENIIEMLDAFESPQEFCVVTEFAQVVISAVVEIFPFQDLDFFRAVLSWCSEKREWHNKTDNVSRKIKGVIYTSGHPFPISF